MTPREITDEDRALIDKYISLLYAEAFIKSDLEQHESNVTKSIIGVVKKAAESEMFAVRRELRNRGIIVKNTAKGVFSCKVRGYDHQVVYNAEMAKWKAEQVVKSMLKNEKPPE